MIAETAWTETLLALLVVFIPVAVVIVGWFAKQVIDAKKEFGKIWAEIEKIHQWQKDKEVSCRDRLEWLREMNGKLDKCVTGIARICGKQDIPFSEGE